MIRLILQRVIVDNTTGRETERFTTVDLVAPSLEALLEDIEGGPFGFEETRIIGHELIKTKERAH